MDLHRPENHADPTDGQLVQRLRGGDGRAMTAVWQRYHARLYSFLLRLCRQPAQAEDLLVKIGQTGPLSGGDAFAG